MAEFGHVLPGVQAIGPINGDLKHASLFFAPENGILTDIAIRGLTAKTLAQGGEIQEIRVFAYFNAVVGGNNTPTTLMVVEPSTATLIPPGEDSSTIYFVLSQNPSFAQGDGIWLGIHFGAAGGNVSYSAGANGAGRTVVASDSFSNGTAATFGTLTSDLSYEMSISGLYIPTSGQPGGVSQILDYSYAGVY